MPITVSPTRQIPVKELIFYAANAKLHPEEQVDQIAKSIKEFTFLDPVAIDENGELLEGHGRVLAAEKLEMESVLGFTISGLTEDQKRAYRLAHNKLTFNSGFNLELLISEVKALSDSGYELSQTGFSSQEIDILISASEPGSDRGGTGDGDSNELDSGETEKVSIIVELDKLQSEKWELFKHHHQIFDDTVGFVAAMRIAKVFV
jgi:ParB-like chromosome segregation protein Spo0J